MSDLPSSENIHVIRNRVIAASMLLTIGAGSVGGAVLGHKSGANNERKANKADLETAVAYRNCVDTVGRITAGGKTAIVRLDALSPKEQKNCGFQFYNTNSSTKAGGDVIKINYGASLVRLPQPEKLIKQSIEHEHAGANFSHASEINDSAQGAFMGFLGSILTIAAVSGAAITIGKDRNVGRVTQS